MKIVEIAAEIELMKNQYFQKYLLFLIEVFNNDFIKSIELDIILDGDDYGSSISLKGFNNTIKFNQGQAPDRHETDAIKTFLLEANLRIDFIKLLVKTVEQRNEDLIESFLDFLECKDKNWITTSLTKEKIEALCSASLLKQELK